MPGTLDLSLRDPAVIRELFDRGIIIGRDGSLLADGGLFLFFDDHRKLEAPLRIDYFHGIGYRDQPVCQTLADEDDCHADEMISLDWRYGFCFRRITHLQRRFRRPRAERYATHMVRTVMMLAKCVARQSRPSKGADRCKAFPHATSEH